LKLRLRVVPTAERHIRAAARWWLEHRPAAPSLFRDELARAFDLIIAQPGIGPTDPSLGLPGVRRFHLSRIRYHLYYRHTGDVVEILALWHSSRGSSPDL
jgi:plasmid stabilization system protein ParE